MKRWLYCLAGLLIAIACNPNGNTPEETNTDDGFVVSGIPKGKVKPFESFILSVSSKSSGYIEFSSDNPSLASITLVDRRQYKVTTKAPQKETVVTITFCQEADDIYPEITKDVSFTLVPESFETGPTAPVEDHPDLEGVKVTFTETENQVVNPERGHYVAKDTYYASDPLKVSEVKAERLAGITLWYLGFYLTDFMQGDISQAYLDMIQSSMDALREGGAKCVLRFAYKAYHNDSEEMDPEVDIVLRHVEQLKPLMQRNEDVIFVLQAGFVGSWGEWYYTTHFGFAPRANADYLPRKRLADALLDAMPTSRQIQLRTPQFKMRMYGLSVKDTITAATAHDGSYKSRLAGHNDCFGASEDDYGTFDNENQDREYWKAETRYTIMGGETCGLSDYCTCTASRKDLEDYHWTYLNKGYNTDVLNRWKTSGCYNGIVARLGYRLVMQDLFYSDNFAAGKKCSVTLRFYNTGYAAPMNPRQAILVWKTSSGKLEETPLGSDPRTWQPGYHTIRASFTPSTSKGTLYLKLSDPLLADNPKFSIALANEDVFDAETGLNKLFEVK